MKTFLNLDEFRQCAAAHDDGGVRDQWLSQGDSMQGAQLRSRLYMSNVTMQRHPDQTDLRSDPNPVEGGCQRILNVSAVAMRAEPFA